MPRDETAPNDPGYDEVRRKLVERGYLQGRIERFLLKDLVAPRGAARRLLWTGLKAAAIGGPILGALLAAAAVAVNRPLLGAADAAVLWLYFGLLSAATLLVLDLLVAAAVATLARRRGVRSGDVLRAGLLVGVPTLAYLLLLWWERQGTTGLLGDLVFLIAAVGATLLIAWLAGIVSLAGIVGRTGEVPDRLRRPAVVLVLVLVPIAAISLLLPEASGAGAGPEPASAFSVPEGRDRLLFVGVDGLDGALVEALAATGAVDGTLVSMQSGAVFPLHRAEGLEPPEVWTTILTGMPAGDHGVRSAGAERLPGVATPLRPEAGPRPLGAALSFVLPTRTVPATGAGRRVRTLWEIVALHEASAAVGWWASWPAREGEGISPPGYVVSDRVLPKLLSGSPEDRDAAPTSLYDRLRNDFPSDREAIRASFEASVAASAGAALRPLVWESFLIDAYAWKVGQRLIADPGVRAAFVYLPGLDILRDRFRARTAPSGTSEAVAQQTAIEGYVRWLDGLVAGVAEPGVGWRTIVVADPGRAAGPGAEGFALVSGGPAQPACVGPAIGILDVAPLTLELLGYPASREMPGRAPVACRPDDALRPSPIATYGRRGVRDEGRASDFDPEMVERLKSLGYLR